MFKFKKLNHLIVATLAAVTFTIVGANLAPKPTSTVVAHAASTVAADGPWETSLGSPILQHVTNGNEIYYSIDPSAPYAQYAINAANAWTNLGVIKLVQVPWGDSRSQINVVYNNNCSDARENAATNWTSGHIIDSIAYPDIVTITMTQGMKTDSAVVKEVVLEHEFGHALGFAHDNRKLNNGKRYRGYHLTMNANGIKKTYQLGGIEQRMLADHYGIQPANGYLNTNC